MENGHVEVEYRPHRHTVANTQDAQKVFGTRKFFKPNSKSKPKFINKSQEPESQVSSESDLDFHY